MTPDQYREVVERMKERHGLSNEDLAEHLGIRPETISLRCCGKRGLHAEAFFALLWLEHKLGL